MSLLFPQIISILDLVFYSKYPSSKQANNLAKKYMTSLHALVKIITATNLYLGSLCLCMQTNNFYVFQTPVAPKNKEYKKQNNFTSERINCFRIHTSLGRPHNLRK